MKSKKFNKKKIFAWYEIVASSLVIILTFYSFIFKGFLPLNFFIAINGFVAGILLLKNKKSGFYLSLLWAFLQIFLVQIGEFVINLTQLIWFALTFIKIFELQNFPDIIFSPNIVGIILLIILIIWRKEFK